ncbi:MAG: hypothetical protein NC177_17880 [Ruminococcus flavefaciens]|nr:hypothetical protein [Ruminococcus flavefaciens]
MEYSFNLIDSSQSSSGTSKTVTISADSVYQKINGNIMKYSEITNVNISYKASYGVIKVGNKISVLVNGTEVGKSSTDDTSLSDSKSISPSYFNSKSVQAGKPSGNIDFKLSAISLRTLKLESASITYTYNLPTYNISLNKEGQGNVSGSGSYTVGATASISAQPNAGYKFNGWSDGNKDNPRKITVTENDISSNVTSRTYTAIFTPCYDLTITSNAGGAISGNGQYDAGDSPKITITPNEGYYISHVVIDGVEQNEITEEYLFENISSNHSVQITFETYKYIVTFINHNGSVLQKSTVNYGSVATYTGELPSKESTVQYVYSFKSWELNVGSNRYGQKIYENTTYIATFTQSIRQYTVSVTSYGNGTVSDNFGNVFAVSGSTPTTKEWKYNYGENITFKTTPSTGYHLITILVDDKRQDNIATYTLTNLQSDHKIKVPFEINQYTVTFKNGNTILQQTKVNHGVIPVYNGSTPTKTSTQEFDYTFSRWSPTIAAATKDTTYTAIFNQTRRKYVITTIAVGDGVIEGGGTYEYGTEVNLTAIPNLYCKFHQWSDSTKIPERTITVTSNKTYTALFRNTVMDADFPSGVILGFCI